MSTQAINLPPLQWELNHFFPAWNEKPKWPLNAAGLPWSSSVSLMAVRCRFEFYNGYMVHTHSWFWMHGHLLVCYSPASTHSRKKSKYGKIDALRIFYPRLKSKKSWESDKQQGQMRRDGQTCFSIFFFVALFCWFINLPSVPRKCQSSVLSGSDEHLGCLCLAASLLYGASLTFLLSSTCLCEQSTNQECLSVSLSWVSCGIIWRGTIDKRTKIYTILIPV